MRVAEIALFTEDPDRLIAFYEDVLEAGPESRWRGGAIFAVGDVKLLIHVAGPSGPDDAPNRDHVAFSVGDVDAAAARLGIEARDYEWGRSAYLTDPDGRALELM